MRDFFDKLIPFLADHYWLTLGFIVALVLVIIEEVRSRGLSARVSPGKAVQMMNQSNAMVVDIRSSSQFEQAHVIHAVNIPQAELESGVKKIERYRDKPVIVVCANGTQSVAAVKKLQKLGFEHAAVLAGGLAAWKSASLPTTAGKSKKKAANSG